MKDFLPNSKDKLFIDEIDPNYGAWLQNPANKFFLYSEGYKKSGEKLYEFCSENRFYLNTLIYPLVFNYRQYIELRLKELIIMGYKYHGIDKDFSNEHSLVKLWTTYRTEIIEPINEIEQGVLDNVGRIINQFNSEDPKSMCFRYPVLKGKDRPQSIKRDTIDLPNFKKVMDKLIYFFDWQWDMLSHYQDLKDEMIADMYSNYY